MNKILLRSICILPAIIVYSLFVYSAPVAPVRTMMILPAADGSGAATPPAMDGVAEDVYGEVQTTQIFNPTGYDADADFTAVFRACWSSEYLFLFAEITDDVAHCYEWGVGNPWEFDNIELFLQLDTNTVTTAYSGTTVQLRVCRGLDSVETAGRASRTDYGYFMESAAAGGWIAEAAVPWTAVMAEGSLPEDFNDYNDAVIGFDFAACDSDNSDGDAQVGNRDVQAAWDMDDPDDPADRTEDLAWNNTSVFGYVILACGCQPIDNFTSESEMQVIPNPAGESIQLQNAKQAGYLVFYSMLGTQVLKVHYTPGEEVNISQLQSGMYVAVFEKGGSSLFVKR